MVDKAFLEVSRLEKRLSRLTKLLAGLPVEQLQSKRWPVAWQSDQRKSLEQSVVSWQDDASVPQCPFCQQEFSSYSFRRHHCRTCGKVVCGDLNTQCSTIVALDVAKSAFLPPAWLTALRLTIIGPFTANEKPVPINKLEIDIRLCKECKATLFDKRDIADDIARVSPDLRAYKNLIQFERGIRLLLPRFQKLLTTLQLVFSIAPYGYRPTC